MSDVEKLTAWSIANELLLRFQTTDTRYGYGGRTYPGSINAERWQALCDRLTALRDAPIPMILHCPGCGEQHIDAPEPERGWTNPPHRSHLCARCGFIWRPADVPTIGVAAIATKGEKDDPPVRYAGEPIDTVMQRSRVQPVNGAGAFEIVHRIDTKDFATFARLVVLLRREGQPGKVDR